jgi:hypothetical protein
MGLAEEWPLDENALVDSFATLTSQPSPHNENMVRFLADCNRL